MWLHADQPHSDSPHIDMSEHANVSHSDTVLHTDVPHSDYITHNDVTLPSWSDHFNISHTDYTKHADTPHTDIPGYHADTAFANWANHTDSPHSDSVSAHGDTPHSDFTNVPQIPTAEILEMWIEHFRYTLPNILASVAQIGETITFSGTLKARFSEVVDLTNIAPLPGRVVTITLTGEKTGKKYSCSSVTDTKGNFACTIVVDTMDIYRISVSPAVDIYPPQDLEIFVIEPDKEPMVEVLEADVSPKRISYDCDTKSYSVSSLTYTYRVRWDYGSSLLKLIWEKEKPTSYEWIIQPLLDNVMIWTGSVRVPSFGEATFSFNTGPEEYVRKNLCAEFRIGAEVLATACRALPEVKLDLKNVKVGIQLPDLMKYSLKNFRATLYVGEKAFDVLGRDSVNLRVDIPAEGLPIKLVCSWDDVDIGGGEIIPKGSVESSVTLLPNPPWEGCDIPSLKIPAPEGIPEYKPYFDIDVRCKTKVYTGENVALRLSILGGTPPFECYIKAEGPTWHSEKEVILEEKTCKSAFDFHFGLPAGVDKGTGTVYISVKDATGRVRTKIIPIEVYPAIAGVTPGVPPPPPPAERVPKLAVNLSVNPKPPWYPGQSLDLEIYVTYEGRPIREAQAVCKYEIDGRRYETPSVKYIEYMGKVGYWPWEITIPKDAAGKTLKIWAVASGLDQYLGEYVESQPVIGQVIGIGLKSTRIILTTPTSIPLESTTSICGYLEGFDGNVWVRIPGAEIKIYMDGNLLGSAVTDEVGNFGLPCTWMTEGRYVVKAVYEGKAEVWEPCQATLYITVSKEITEPAPTPVVPVTAPSPAIEPPLPSPGVSTVILEVSPSPPWTSGQSITLTAKAYDGTMPAVNKLIYFYEVFENSCKLIHQAYTDYTGTVKITHKLPDKEGTISFVAVYVEKGAISNTIVGFVQKPTFPLSVAAILTAIAGALGGLIYFFRKS
ncbi:MAG: hypothetical protein QXL06_01950 [Nitrososphaerota archaeon]